MNIPKLPRLPNAYDLIISCLSLLVIINGYFLNSLHLAIASAVASVAIAVIAEIIIEYIKTRKIIFSKSPVVSGLIIASIVQIGSFDKIAMAAILAMILKKLIKKEEMPIFNPAAPGLFITFLFNQGLGEVWWANGTGATMLATLVLGLIVSWRIKKLYISFSYLLVFLLLNFLHPAFDLAFLPLFSAFFMITEPKTTPNERNHQLIFGAFASIIIHVFGLLALPSSFLLGILVSNLAGKIFLK